DNVTIGIASVQELCDAVNSGETNITLTKDLDASAFTKENNFVIDYFEGTLNGNGHTIYNLKVPLFDDLYCATVKNLNIQDANIQGKNSILVVTMTKATVENIRIIDSVIDSPEADTVGGIASLVYYNSSIKNSSVENISIKASHTIGGVAGRTESGAVIEKVSVIGKLEGSRQGNEGAQIGGISGVHYAGSTNANGTKTSIKNCYSQVVINAPASTGNGGLIGGPSNTAAGILEKSLAYAQGMCNGIAGFKDQLGTVSNISQIVGTGVVANTANGIMTVTSMDQSTMAGLGLPEKAWELYHTSGQEDPYLAGLAQIDGYNGERTKAYKNLSMLAYALDRAELVKAGNNLTDSDLLNKQIERIYPISRDGKYVAGLVSGEEDSLAKILIEFTDGSRKEISLTHAYTADGLVAIYRSTNPAITYHFDKYVSNPDESIKTEILNIVRNYTYATNLDPVTSTADRRQYKDYYEEKTATRLDEFVTLQMISQEDYPFYIKDVALKNNLKAKLQEELPQLLYTYNYINKWYDFEIGSLNPSLLLYFDGEKLSELLTQDVLVQSVVKGDKSNTHQTYEFFEKYLQPRTADNLYIFLENMIKVAGYPNPNEWFLESYDGMYREQTALQMVNPTDLRYRIWENITRLYGEKSILLPVLTAPQEDMILISAPSQIFISTINRYHSANTEQSKKAMEATLDNFCRMLGTYFGSIVNIVPGASEELNSRVIINYDTAKDFKSTAHSGTQQSGVSQEPVYKWVYESVDRWKDIQSAAYTWDGSETFFVDTSLLGEYVGFRIFTHENAHSQDGTLFYLGNGRRNVKQAEYHADGVLAQDFYDGTMSFNLSKEIDYKEDVIVNLSPERINTPEKLKDYYKDMFDVNYVLDYLIAEAFLTLTPEEQSKVVVKAYESSGGSTMSLSYGKLSEQTISDMKLTTIDDLIYNKLSIISQSFSGSMAGYYVESFWNIKWYQPSNPTGSADEASFKGFSHEMLGYAGYENGFVTWLSGKSANDLDALRQITGDPNTDFDKYKKSRYTEVEQKLSQIPWFNTDEVISQFAEALRQDGSLTWVRNTTQLKKIYYQTVKRATNDFTDGNIYELPKTGEVSTAQQLAEILQSNKPVYVKLTAHIDMSQLPYQNGYYFENFTGIIDGNGFEIYGMKAPLFNQITFGRFKNMNFDVSGIKENQGTGILSKTSKHILVDRIRYDKSLGVPLTAEGIPAGWIYRVYHEITNEEAYDSPRD
ncbi:MAG: hypothetical protein IKW28_03675, partial [Lachnospiraceae bacterium]|nr:hypothetical protein [Lachnospiraceae bacterium]